MFLKYRNLFTKPFNIILGLFCIAFIGSILFTFNNENFYNKPIGQIIDVKHVSSTPTKGAQNNRDIKYKNQLKVKILNGQFAGETTTINHQYVKSQADSEAFRTHEKVLLHISNKPSDAYIIEKKRDTLTVIITGLFLLTVLLVGRKVGLQSILSLILNSIAILIAIYIHIQHSNINLFLLMTIAMICSTILTLLLVTGWHMRTLITIASTIIGTFLSIGLTELIIYMTDGKGIKYETMNFLSLPPKDIFLASVLIGSLGAIMDVAITIASGMHEILQRTPHISMRRWALAGRNIGQDIMGTMTNILLFSYLSGALPMFLIFLKNANTVTYTISMNWSLEIARALTGGIGIVLTIPITILFMEIFETLRRAKQ
ncbi:TPA: YibE/F family protein [Staphylococcus aureus]|nr:YibE/F family protein [Staphylococcus aureus]HDP6082712.1 YibE/F family protein [Staphylococcus aureus]